jgi:hypothetical protein
MLLSYLEISEILGKTDLFLMRNEVLQRDAAGKF